MKARRYLFRAPAIFGIPLKYGVPVFAGFTVIASGLSAHGGDILRGGAGGNGNKPGRAATAGAPTPAATDAARANAKDTLARTTRTLASVRAMQDAARAAAKANQGKTNQTAAKVAKINVAKANLKSNLPKVPDGLGSGGLQIAPGAATDPGKWSGAKLPVQTVKGGKTKVVIKQTEQQALLEWQTLNIGKNTTLKFDQKAGGADSGKWIAFNRVTDPTGNPTRILGNLKADGQVYIVNTNGIIFGAGSQVNTRALTASALPLNSNLVQKGLLNNPDAQFLFSGIDIPAGINGTSAFTPEAPVNGKYGDVIVKKGAKIESPTNSAKVGGRVTLVGANVSNQGTISTPDGQTILAAGLQVGFDGHSSSDPGLRGLDVFVGQVGDYAGTATNEGLIESNRGNIIIAGKEVNQLGVLKSTTSVSLNGRIDLQAQYNAVSNRGVSARGDLFLFRDTGKVEIGKESLIEIRPELKNKETTIGTELALRSQVNIRGKTIHFGENATLFAPNAKVNVSAGTWNFINTLPLVSTFTQTGGQVYLDKGVLIDVSGSTAVPVPVSQNIIEVQLRGAELAGSPLQRNGPLRNITVKVDIRDAGVYQQDMWIGTALADLSGFVNLIQKGVGQLTVAGGTVNITGGDSVVMQAGSKIDVSGGSIKYTGGGVQTTQLVLNGRLVDISKATPDEVYDGIYDGNFTKANLKWGIIKTYKNALAPDGYRYEATSTHGGAGGGLAIAAPSMALDGSLVGKTINGEYQRINPVAAASLKLGFYAQDTSYPSLPLHSPSAPDVVFSDDSTQQAADPFSVDADGNPTGLSDERKETVYLSSSLLKEGGFGSLTIENHDGNIIVPENFKLETRPGGSITFQGANITVNGSVTAAGGSLSFTTHGLSLDAINQIQNSPTSATPPTVADGNGVFTLGSKGILSTAGQIVDDRTGSKFAGVSPVSLKGGTIKIEGYTAKLSEGGLVDVSGGAMSSATGSISYGNAGSLSIAAGREVGFSATLGGKLELGATLQGYSGSKAGSLSLTAPAIQIGGISSNPDVNVLSPDFFNQGGFGTIGLTGIGMTTPVAGEYVPGVYISEGARIAPVVQSYFARTNSQGKLVLDVITREEGVRAPANLSFNATGAAYNGVPLVIGNVVMGEGSSIKVDGTITTDANIATAGRGSVSFSGQTVTVLGSVIAPGGTITIAGRDQFPTDASVPPTNALTTTHIGSTAHLSTAGKVLLVENPFGLRQGQVLSGGTISVSGNIVAEKGAVLDVSGAKGTLDLSLSAGDLNAKRDGSRTIPVTIESNGGTINLTGSEMLFTDATLIGKAGGGSATGGTLNVSSGRFIPNLTPYTTADVNLVVTQSGRTIPNGYQAGAGEVVLDENGEVAEQLGHFSIDSYDSGGFHSLALNGNVRFEGKVSIEAPGSLRVASGGVIHADSNVLLKAGHVALGQAFRAPTQLSSVQYFTKGVAGTQDVSNHFLSPTHGSGSLTVKADLIDIGDLSLQGIGSASFLAPTGDIRGNGTLHIAGDFRFKAGQIYPVTQRDFNIFAYDYTENGIDRKGSVTIERGTKRSLPLSGGGTLSIYASNIVQGGTLRAPIGTINLGWDGTGTAPVDPLAGNPTQANPFERPVTSTLTLRKGSVTSVSAIDPITGKGVVIPYGISLDGKSWIDPAGNDITISGAPSKAINLSGVDLKSEKGSKIDIRGGGNLLAYRWITGNGGKKDILASEGAFAVIPGYGFDYAPYAPFNPDSTAVKLDGQPGYVNGGLKVGDTITLGDSAELPGGTYTLLPARYALLPGAFLVTPQGAAPVGTIQRADGSSLVSGYVANNLDASRQGATMITRFEIAGSKVVRARAEYQDLLANTVLADAALAREFAVPRLPKDAGYLSFSSTGDISLAGKVDSRAPKTGRGSLIDISSPADILINKSGTGGSAGQLVLSATLLNSFGAESLLVGGLRTFTTEGVSVSVTADNLVLNNKGAALRGTDIVLVASENLSLSKNSRIIASGNNRSLDAISIGNAETAGSGNGALVRVSGNDSGTVTRSGVTSSSDAALALNSGVKLSGGSIYLDSTSATSLNQNAEIVADSVSLSSGRINIRLNKPGTLLPNTGIVITGNTLDRLQDSSKRLSLLSYSSIDIYGTGKLGSENFEQLALQSSTIRGINNGGGTVTLAAKNLVIENPTGLPPAASLSTGLQGTLRLDADIVTLGDGDVLARGFSDVVMSGSRGVLTSGEGSFTTAGEIHLVAPTVTGASASDYSIKAGSLLSLAKTGTSAAGAINGGFGATLSLEGGRVNIAGDISLASGELTLHATNGDVAIGQTGNAGITTGGTATRFADVTRYTSGGIVNLTADRGSVRVGDRGTISVSAAQGGGNAGSIRVKTPEGRFDMDGSISAHAGRGGRDGSFSLDAGSIAGGSLASLDSILNAGDFSLARSYRFRNGDILVDGIARSHGYQVVADNGSITVSGTINASGATGGDIRLQSSGSLILRNGSVLNASGREFDNAGKGGFIALEAGAHRSGVIDRDAMLDLRDGSTINLSVAAENQNSASLGQFSGKLHLRAPRNAANTDVQIDRIAADIKGASSILVEGYKVYTVAGEGVITTTLQNTIKADATAFLGEAGSTTAGYTAMLERLTGSRTDLDLILAPGAEIINTDGNITLGATNSTATSDWNLQTFRFGPVGAPGVLTLRASGSLIFYNALSDGFAAVTPSTANGQSSLWLAPLMAANPLLPTNTQSWSYRLTSGADLSSADFGAVLPQSQLQTDKGSLLLGKNYGNAASYGSGTNFLTATAIANRYQVIRTGSGDIEINSGRDVTILNQFATIYTAGTRVTNPTSLFRDDDFVLPQLQATGVFQPLPGSLGAAQQNYFVQYSMAGGDVSIHAEGDISRMTRTVATGNGGSLIADSSRQLPTHWLYRRGFVDPVTGEFGIGGVDEGSVSVVDSSASTTWWVDFSNFFEGVGTLGGGNVTLTAGSDVRNMDAVAATNARMASGRPSASRMIELGGGDVTITAGDDIDGGVYYVERGTGRLQAGGNITTNETRSPSRGILSSLTNPQILDSNTWLPTTLFLGKGSFDLQAGGDLLMGPVANAFLLPQGYGNKYWYKTYFNTYGANSGVNAISLGGDLTFRTEVSLPTETTSRPALGAWMFANNTLSTSQGAALFQPWLRIVETNVTPFQNSLFGLMAPNLNATALSGDINLAGDLTLFPAARGQVEILASGSISGLQASGFNTNLGVQRFITSTINLSDADPASIPGVTNPYAYAQLVGRSATALRATGADAGAGFLNFIDTKFTETGSTSGALETEQALHTPGRLHRDDDEPLRVFAMGGDIDGITLFSPKETRVLAGRDIGDVAFYFQNLSASDTSVVSAGRDITLYNANTASRAEANTAIASNTSVQLVPLAGDIQISGPGNLQVLAGRTLDLGIGAGNADGTGVGITSIGNGRNPYLGFSGADVTVAAGIGPASSLAGSDLKLDSFIRKYVTTEDGLKLLEKIAPGIDFASQSSEEKARLAMEVFYRLLRNAGRDFNDPDSATFGNYKNGKAAVKALFGGGTWEGDILTQGRDIRTRNGGDISIITPGGGLSMAETTIGNPLTPPGIVTESGGNISIFADQSVSIGIGRIFTLRGGNAVIWSSKGDIAAGSSSRTVAAAPPTRVLIDPQSASVETDLAGLATGGGIGVLATVEGVAPGDVDLIAPTGSIDAGDAGIRVSGNINLAGVTIVNAGNISAGGTSTGTPSTSVSAPSIATVTSASNSTAAAAATTTKTAPEQPKEEEPTITESPSVITVEVIGYGESSAEEEEDEEQQEEAGQ